MSSDKRRHADAELAERTQAHSTSSHKHWPAHRGHMSTQRVRVPQPQHEQANSQPASSSSKASRTQTQSTREQQAPSSQAQRSRCRPHERHGTRAAAHGTRSDERSTVRFTAAVRVEVLVNASILVNTNCKKAAMAVRRMGFMAARAAAAGEGRTAAVCPST